jgi:serine/threonine-protein kinase CHEK1
MEVTVHKHIGDHRNIISFFHTGEDLTWRWIAMELAEGGDLFDKIEADEGVGEDIAHLYFTQLISAVSYMHSKGVGHRDLKPENVLLSADGNLKIADFGLATVFEYNGKMKMCTTLCGSPPYIAPEVISCSTRGQTKGTGYRADFADIWSCGVVLFVLLAGNTPWDSPTENSFEFSEYLEKNARTTDDLWQRLPSAVLSLLRGMMKVNVDSRFTMEDVRRHPWFTRPNKYLSTEGKLRDQVNLATSMFESLHIDFTQDPLAQSQRSSQRAFSSAMDIDMNHDLESRLSSTQPDMPMGNVTVDWDTPLVNAFSSTQPTDQPMSISQDYQMAERLEDEPAMSQFSQNPSVPLSRTQNAQKFQDIIPSRSLNRFYSSWALKLLVPFLSEALHRLGVPVPSQILGADSGGPAVVRVATKDQRLCLLQGNIIVECVSEGLFEVEFTKIKGDPLEWRRFFKKIAVLCKDAVYKPD